MVVKFFEIRSNYHILLFVFNSSNILPKRLAKGNSSLKIIKQFLTVFFSQLICLLPINFFIKFQSLPFPLTIVVCHLFLKFGLAAFCRQVYVSCFGYCKSEVPEKRIVLPWKVYLQRVLLVAATSALDIGLSQWSLKYITVALYTMTKTTSILFILGFGLALGLEKKVIHCLIIEIS